MSFLPADTTCIITFETRGRLRASFAGLVCAALLAVASPGAGAADYSVAYNPYGGVDWATTLRCQSQHHDHAESYGRITALDAAGYCAVTFMTYSGRFRPSNLSEWNAAGNPNPDPGKPVDFGPPRRWPPEDFGAPQLPLTNLKFYLPGAEEIGLYATGSYGQHVQSTFLTTYIEGAGCLTCGIGGIPVVGNTPAMPPSQVHASSQELIDRVVENGGHATINHPAGASSAYMQYSGLGSVEMFNNYHRNADDFAGNDAYSNQMMAIWDHLLEHKSPRIWGVASNDWFSAWTPLGQTYSPTQFGPVTPQNRDRGKLQVLLPSYDLESYRAAFEAGAFFAIVEDNAIKAAYPIVTNVAVGFDRITISTAIGTESIRWIGNGSVLAYTPTLVLDGLPDGLVYVRAEISDGEGRTVYTQPFSLGDPLPPPPGPPIPAMSRGALACLALLLLAAVSLRSAWIDRSA